MTPPAAPALRGAIVLVGFMGAGKSSVARDLAGVLGVTAVDTDRLIEDDLGLPVAEAFARDGEAAFRATEERAVRRALDASAPGDVIALGGGACESPRTREALRAHLVVHLDVELETAWQRVGAGARDDRPLARDREAFAALHARREATYRAVADATLPAIDRGVARRALPALRALPPGTRLLWAHATSAEHPVYVGPGALDVAPWPEAGRGFCVTDEHVGALHLARLPATARTTTVTLTPGEAHKTLATLGDAASRLAAAGATRADHVVALGGGVVGDVAGFLAATYQRGVPVVQVPTTLVAQVDSAYGGKTGVDLPEAKNYVGAYHLPAAVLVDPSLLETLPEAERAAGRAEVVKTALIAGGALWDAMRGGDLESAEVIEGCARTKLAIVAADERDGGRRQVLNLGHTVGHAIETVTGYTALRHGEAVALGLLAALRLSGVEDLRDEVCDLLRRAGLPTALPAGVDAEAVVAATAKDKKRLGEAPTPFVLARSPGDVTPGHAVAPADVRAAVEELAAA